MTAVRANHDLVMHHPRPFLDRAHAGCLLAERLLAMPWERPVVLGIPRGGVEVAAPIAAALHAELDVALARKLGTLGQSELAMGALSEDGGIWLDVDSAELIDPTWMEREVDRQWAELDRQRALFRNVRPRVELAGRDAIVVDDGLATGSTMMACLLSLGGERTRSLVVAVPVAPPDRLDLLRGRCTSVVCLLAPREFQAVGQFYDRFDQVPDGRVVELLRTSLEAP